MKKILFVAIFSVAVFAVSGQAQAYFEDDHLIQVFYSKNNKKVEIGADLGKLGKDFKLTDQNKKLKTVNYKAIAAKKGAAVSDLRMGMYIDSMTKSTDSVWDHYFVTTKSTTPATPTKGWYKRMNLSTEAIERYYQSNRVSPARKSVVTANPANVNSYSTRMNHNFAAPGTYGTMFTRSSSTTPGELILKNLTSDYQDLYLWHFSYDVLSKTSQLVAGVTNDYSAVLRFFTNGTTLLNPTAHPSAVPVPGALWLLASGLASLAGLRRQRNC